VPATSQTYPLSLHDALPIYQDTKDACIVKAEVGELQKSLLVIGDRYWIGNEPTKPQPFSRLPISWNNAFGGDGHEKNPAGKGVRSEEHTSELQSRENLVCRL